MRESSDNQGFVEHTIGTFWRKGRAAAILLPLYSGEFRLPHSSMFFLTVNQGRSEIPTPPGLGILYGGSDRTKAKDESALTDVSKESQAGSRSLR